MPKMTMLIGEVVYCGNNVNNALVDHDLYTIITENVRDSYMLIDDSFTLVKFNKQFVHLFGFKVIYFCINLNDARNLSGR